MRALRAALVLPLLLLVALAAAPVLTILPGARRTGFKQKLTRLGLAMVGVRPRVVGTLLPGPSLVLSNHASYLDILLLQQLGEIRFTPKREIAAWPVFGRITTAFGALYIDRRPSRAGRMGEELAAALGRGDRISLFPEGTTSDGTALLPFRSALLRPIEVWPGPNPPTVQPVALRYRHPDGTVLTPREWRRVAWFADMSLLPHLFGALGGLGLVGELVCLPPVATEGRDRRQIAGLCRDAIADALEG